MNRYTLGMPVVAAIVFAAALPAAAQSVTTSDIQRLQDQVYEAGADISRMRANGDTAAQLQRELDDVRDEVVYLKVKLRKEGTVSRNDFDDLQRRVQDLRSRARGGSTAGSSNSGWRTNSDPAGSAATGSRSPGGTISGGVSGTQSEQGTRTSSDNSAIPVGQELDARLQGELSSATAEVEQRFEVTTVADLLRGDEVLIPAGSIVRGIVSSVTRATRLERKGSLTVAFDQVTIRGRNYPMRGTVVEALESEGIRGEAGKIGTGAGIGAIIGGIIGGVKGALLGVLIGGGGTIAATEGEDVTLPAGTILRIRLDTPPAIR
jgi:hypothetical protein